MMSSNIKNHFKTQKNAIVEHKTRSRARDQDVAPQALASARSVGDAATQDCELASYVLKTGLHEACKIRARPASALQGGAPAQHAVLMNTQHTQHMQCTVCKTTATCMTMGLAMTLEVPSVMPLHEYTCMRTCTSRRTRP